MTLALSAVLYLSAGIFLAGMSWRVSAWVAAPVPLNIVLTPAPGSRAGAVRRLTEEMVCFRSLLEADRGLWLLAWLFHLSLGLLLIGHVAGLLIGLSARFHPAAQIVGGIVGLLAMGTLLGLLMRRLALERLRWISNAGDYFALILLLLIVASGDQMRFLTGVDMAQAQRFVWGWVMLHPAAPPANWAFTAHVVLVSLLLICIPFSKLLHLAGAALFNPALIRHESAGA